MSPARPKTQKERVERAREILLRLARRFPDARCELNFSNPLELLVATILSAQCTDQRVNKVTPILFSKYRTAEDFARADLKELEAIIRPTGFFRNKARSIKAACQIIAEKHGGNVPARMDDLIELPGIARKTANVILGVGFAIPSGIVVDTHVRRVARRLDLSRQDNPDKIERDLMNLYPRQDWIMLSHLLIFHGRYICLARRPKCEVCPVYDLCYARDKIAKRKPRGVAGS